MMIAVRSASRVCRPSCTRRSLGMSRDAVASSRISTDRVGDERPREREQLALTGRHPPTALVHVGVVAVRQTTG